MGQKKFITGNQAVLEAAINVGAQFMAGYPISPTTEILEGWSKLSAKNKKYQFLQTEDETAAGFNVIGAILSNKMAFTATTGPGNILMQDPIIMAEAMRLPFVGIIMQRGGPSTGTMVYGQQELTLTCFGGNGEGLRIVYSTASPQELYDYTIKCFNSAWKYKFPSFILGDGYQAKQKTEVTLKESKKIKADDIFAKHNQNLRNCFNFENELNKKLVKDINDFKKHSSKIIEYFAYKCWDAEIIICAHGIVSLTALEAINTLRKMSIKVGLFRPITLNPFPQRALNIMARNCKTILIAESANGHFFRLVKANLNLNKIIYTLFRPVVDISPQDIINKIDDIKE
ncbi:MAG: ferredoxin oxidoreductase [Patescibacteria group bacterium]|nr:ferredoxin oxidoreductase [Patescibacteria group bacterium]